MKVMTFVVSLLVAGTAIAQDNNPTSPAYHAIHNPQSPYYNGPRQEPQRQQPPQPTGYWEKTWGAISTDGTKGSLGTALGAASKEDAQRLAKADCQAKGGNNCTLQLAYHNQCSALIVGQKGLAVSSAASVEEAKSIGLGECSKSEGKGCRVYYSACTEPIFHRY